MFRYALPCISLFSLFILDNPYLHLFWIFGIAPTLDLLFYIPPPVNHPIVLLPWVGWLGCMAKAFYSRHILCAGIVWGQGLVMMRHLLSVEKDPIDRGTSLYAWVWGSLSMYWPLAVFAFSPGGRILVIGVIVERTIAYVEHYGLKDPETQWEYDGDICNMILLRPGSVQDNPHHHRLPWPYPWMMALSLFPSAYDRCVFQSRKNDLGSDSAET